MYRSAPEHVSQTRFYSINLAWEHDDESGYRRLREDLPALSSNSSSPYATLSRRHSIYSGDSSDDSGINDGPKRFSHYFTKKRNRPQKEDTICLKADSCAFIPSTFPQFDRLAFLNLSLATSDLDGGLPLLAYLLEPVQRVMRYPLLLKNLKYVLMRCPMRHAMLVAADHALEITEQLAIITNLTQPFKSIEPSEPQKTDKKPHRRRFEFMRQAAQRLRLRAR